MMLIATVAMPASAQEVSLPGGANTLNETHGAWTVTCAIRTRGDSGKAKRCALSQTQLHSQTRQRALAIELHSEGGGVKGALVLPFGLALASGVTYQLDEGETGAPQHFRTCLPIGCLVDIAFDAGTVASLEAGDVLNVKATADGGQEMAFSISLAGFSSAYDRAVELMR
jgi:invasion protein IalB